MDKALFYRRIFSGKMLQCAIFGRVLRFPVRQAIIAGETILFRP